MNTSETSTANLDNKIRALALLPQIEQEWAKKFCGLWDISIPVAMAVHQEWVTELSDRGVDEINRCFFALANVFEKNEQEMLDYLANPE